MLVTGWGRGAAGESPASSAPVAELCADALQFVGHLQKADDDARIELAAARGLDNIDRLRVWDLVHAADGHIKVISELGVGSEFLIYLPALATGLPAADGAGAGHTDSAADSASTILVVDDEAPVAEIFGEMLGRLGHSVTTLHSPHEALQLFRADPQRFDLIVTDQTMPGLSGDELAREMLAIRPSLPIIICSGHSELDEATALDLGVRRLLAKPVTNATLCAAVRDCLEAERA